MVLEVFIKFLHSLFTDTYQRLIGLCQGAGRCSVKSLGVFFKGPVSFYLEASESSLRNIGASVTPLVGLYQAVCFLFRG